MTLRLGVIGGTGLYDWGPGEPIEVETPYGSVATTHHRRAKGDILFLARHGPRHEVPAHRVDGRAAIRAMQAARVDYLIAFFNVGLLHDEARPGPWIVLDDLVDLSHGRPRAFHDEAAFHVDFRQPFCAQGSQAVAAVAPPGTRLGGTYASTDGPRFETAAEARMLRTLGADVAGMTAGPEAALAREAGLCYIGLAFTGNAVDKGTIRAREVQKGLARKAGEARAWVDRALGKLPLKKRCTCRSALEDAPLATRRGKNG